MPPFFFTLSPPHLVTPSSSGLPQQRQLHPHAPVRPVVQPRGGPDELLVHLPHVPHRRVRHRPQVRRVRPVVPPQHVVILVPLGRHPPGVPDQPADLPLVQLVRRPGRRHDVLLHHH